MRTNKGSARRKAASLTLFLAMMTGAAYAVSPETGTSGAVSFSVNLREWFVLEVQTPDVHMESSGAAGAGVTTTMSPDGIPARIKALAVVAHNQTVELKVQVFGDLVGPSGETLPLSDVTWAGSGEGFLSGRFTPAGSAVLARWMGPGFHEGTVQYFSPQANETGRKYVQRIVYSLMST